VIPADQALFAEKKKYMYAVFERTLLLTPITAGKYTMLRTIADLDSPRTDGNAFRKMRAADGTNFRRKPNTSSSKRSPGHVLQLVEPTYMT
jgi:ABC-type iron transport system FetAB ATPase subunit